MKIKQFLSILCLCVVVSLQAQNSAESTVDAFFEALNTKNVAQVKRLCVSDINLVSLSTSGDARKVTTQALEDFLSSLAKMPETLKINEVITKSKSRDNDHIAQFWLEYEFYINKKLSHTGVNSISLIKTNDGWKISAISDTRHTKK